MDSGIELRETGVVALCEQGSCFSGGRIENVLCFRIRIKRLASLYAYRLELIDHCLVAGKPRLGLDDAVEVSEETCVVTDRGIEDDVGHVSESCRRRIGRL